MDVTRGRSIAMLGVLLLLAGLLVFGMASPSAVSGGDSTGLPTDVGDTGAGAQPPASLPSTGGGIAESGGWTSLLVATALTGTGVALIGGGLIAQRRRQTEALKR